MRLCVLERDAVGRDRVRRGVHTARLVLQVRGRTARERCSGGAARCAHPANRNTDILLTSCIRDVMKRHQNTLKRTLWRPLTSSCGGSCARIRSNRIRSRATRAASSSSSSHGTTSIAARYEYWTPLSLSRFLSFSLVFSLSLSLFLSTSLDFSQRLSQLLSPDLLEYICSVRRTRSCHELIPSLSASAESVTDAASSSATTCARPPHQATHSHVMLINPPAA
jgi:hypothetical protein